MSSAFDNTAPPRFFRPPDATRLPRNMRRIQLQRLEIFLRNCVFAAALVAVGVWAFRQTQ